MSGALALAAIHGDVSTTEKIQMTKVGNGASVKPRRSGLVVKAGDRLYIPAGGLRISMDKDGTISFSASVAVDPWLPDMSANGGTSDETVDAIMRNGFPVSSICGDHVNACQKSQSLYELIHHPDVARLKHMAVIDGRQAVGVLDLDKARKYHDSNHVALVDRVYEPLRRDHCLKGYSPLIDYILTADKRPFRLVDIGGKLHAVDVFDLQKLPVRVLLFMKFVHLETLVARHLCLNDPTLLDVIETVPEADFGELGNLGTGPLRKVETYYIDRLLIDAQRMQIIKIEDSEIKFLKEYRNRLAHGPRWYVTRPSEVTLLVRCAKRVSELTSEMAGKLQKR